MKENNSFARRIFEMILGEKITGLRKSRGISQELLAENSNISLRTIQTY
jgi:transcriptional regulator with XRE-family HTH domain